MIDVVFLLLVFFMLAARFGSDEALPLRLASGGSAQSWSGPPRLITVLPDGARLNGREVADLTAALASLMRTPDEPILLRPGADASTGDLARILAELRAAGFTTLAVLGPAP